MSSEAYSETLSGRNRKHDRKFNRSIMFLRVQSACVNTRTIYHNFTVSVRGPLFLSVHFNN